MEKSEGLKKLREPFPENQVSKLPKGSKAQNDCPASEKRNCTVCGGWHHPKIIHLDYVGHAAITDRLLDADPMWSWEPMALTDEGLPRFDASGGLWIRLTVCGMTRLGYGHAKGKTGEWSEPGAREKEVIGDALRNAGMRFGAALDLWHKGDLNAHKEEQEPVDERVVKMVATLTPGAPAFAPAGEPLTPEDEAVLLLSQFETAKTLKDVDDIKEVLRKAWGRLRGVKGLQDSIVAMSINAHNRIKADIAAGVV